METEKSILEEFELLININKPLIIKKATPFINYIVTNIEGNKRFLTAFIEVYAETEDSYTCLPFIADADSFEKEEEKESIKEELTKSLFKALKIEIDEGSANKYWEDRDLEQEIWKRKEE